MSARTYLVGLPVVVTVRDDGHVVYEIDTAEAGIAIREGDHEGVSESQATADSHRVDADHDRRVLAQEAEA